MKRIIMLFLLTVFAAWTLVGCSGSVIVAEKGSAGEKVAQTLEGYEYTAVDSQNKALMEVMSGTADAAIVDYVLTIGSIGEGTDFAGLQVSGEGYAPESYGIAFRKGSDVTARVNEAIAQLRDSGRLAEIARKYKLEGQLTADESFEAPTEAGEDSDWAFIQQKGELVIGITYFAPMNYLDADGQLVGFETEFATAVCEMLGVKPRFEVINWGSKEMELNSKTIDCIWNGMTIDEDKKETMSLTIPYMQNKQVMIVKR